MNRLILFFVLVLMNIGYLRAQQVNGIIYTDTLGISVIKIWGTHQQRGYALGYLTGSKITNVIVNYIKPQLSVYYNLARQLVIQGNDLGIPQDYKDEAQSVIEGMNASGTNPDNLDQTDILVGNSLLDVANLLFKLEGPGCSALMSWNDATAGTDLDGKSVITRHLDWTYSSILVSNHVIVIHFPSETDEKKWMLVGFSGMISALSGLNEDYSAFQHVLADFVGSGLHNKLYLPIWMALRQSLEAADYNGDGSRNVQDIRSELNDCSNGFASGYIVTSLARSAATDSLVAMVAELTPASPTHTFRYNDYPDNITGDNLYASNYQIKRNDAHNYDSRYNSVKNNMGDGTLIGLDTNWNIMRDHSSQSINMQFMQFAPEINLFRIAVYRDGQPAYLNDPVIFDLNDLFADPTVSVGELSGENPVTIYPNPVSGIFYLAGISQGNYLVEVFDQNGRMVLNRYLELPKNGIDFTSFTTGIYTIRLINNDFLYTSRFVKR